MANGLWRGSHRAAANLADELDADWEQVKVRFVTGKAAYKIAFRQEAAGAISWRRSDRRTLERPLL